MNQIIIIGNGFDLAHDLKTSYSDFLLWYFNQAVTIFDQKNIYEDELISIKIKFSRRWKVEIPYNNLSDVFEYLRRDEHIFIYKSNFFRKIINQNVKYNWVDIEIEYYQALVRQYKNVELTNVSDREIETLKTKLKEINQSLEVISSFLIKYLTTITLDTSNKISEIQGHFKIIENEVIRNKGSILIINFNYTSVIDLYLQHSARSDLYKKIDIHGSISDESNPIIFGYGDEMEPNFQKLENFNDNDILKHMKSISYFKTLNYSTISDFLKYDDFTVHIMGHSCGLSDRLLLNRIFEHDKCRIINIFYHQKNENENDYSNKTIEIFRHFKNKALMQERIVPYPRCKALLSSKSLASNPLSIGNLNN